MSTEAFTWKVQNDASPEDLALLSNGVFAHGRALASDGNAESISCLVRHQGVVVAGASGRTEYTRLFVNHLWVAEEIRNQGIARRILTEMESGAAARGCRDALIETLDESVAALYARLGYQSIAVIHGYVGRFNRHIMLKASIASTQ